MNTRIGRSRIAKQAREIQFHSDNMAREGHPAINVKYHGPAVEMPGLSEQEQEWIWESVCEAFWNEAATIAHQHGYSGVFSEGRSAGWLLPYYQGAAKYGGEHKSWPGQGPEWGYPSYPDIEDATERKRFVRFQKAILTLLAYVPENLASEAEFRMEEKREAARAEFEPTRLTISRLA